MQRILLAALMGIGITSLATTVPASAAEAPASFVVAQGVDVRIGPGGVRIGGDEDRDRGRDRDRRRFRERDGDRERVVERRRRDEGCRTIIVRRETPNGTVTRRTRRCD